MINFPPSLKAVGGARTGIAPVNLLDVLTLNNDLYLFSDRLMNNVPSAIEATAAIAATPPILPVPAGQAVAWCSALTTGSHTLGIHWTAESTLNSARLTDTANAAVPTTWAFWTGFTPPILPPGATVVGIYPVVIAEIIGVHGNPQWGASIGYDPSGPSEFAFGLSNGENYIVGGVGTDITILKSLTVGCRFFDSAFFSDFNELDISFIGIAVYYTLPTYGTPGDPEIPGSGIPPAEYLPWLMSVPEITFHRSLQTDMGSFVLQNVSGDTLSRDMES